jgi:diguanylate cyclase (GGDEF)-like protein/putative nucleotidyltransferase with HDIG domain
MQARGVGSDAGEEAREVSGMTTRLAIAYVEEKAGRLGVERLLEGAGLSGREADLRDENRWFPDRFRVALFESAATVLGDPHVAERIGAASLNVNVGGALKLSLRALGSPRLLFANIGRANAKFNRVHRMDAVEVGTSHARLRNRPVGDTPYHPCDCDYNVGLLSRVPVIFGGPAARISHPRCIGRGDPECIFDVHWSPNGRPTAETAATAGALLLLAGCALFVPSLIPVAIVLASVIAIVAGTHAIGARRSRTQLTQTQLREQAEVTDLLMTSMQDLVSELQLDDVLSKITANAQSAVGGAEFALLVEDDGAMRCRSSSDLPDRVVGALERWADGHAELHGSSMLVEDLNSVAELAELTHDRAVTLGSLCAAPLVFRDAEIGVLVALGADDGFLPRDVELLSTYAAQAAIALTNATLYETQQRLAIQDPLTGLYNHRHFHEVLGQELERCRRHGDELGLVLMDLNGFKQINDTEGHAAGDEVLRRVARSLESAARSSDVAFRVGGDEFALLLPGSGTRGAGIAAARAQSAIESACTVGGVSYGIASWPHDGPTKDALIGAADADLYGMKRQAKSEAEGSAQPLGGRLARHERLASASRIALKLAPLHEEDAIARSAIDELDESFGLHYVAIHVIGEDSALRLTAAAGAAAADPAHRIRSAEQGVPGRAVASGEAKLVEDVSSAQGRGGHSVTGAGSELAAPIRVDGEPWGVLELVHEHPRELDFIDLLFADTIASAIGAAIHRAKLYAELEGTFMRTLAVLSDALEAKDSYTAAHAREVADLAVDVGSRLGMKPDELRTLSYGALLHDIGKIGVRGEILHKPGELTAAEYDEMKEHTVVGARMLERIPYFRDVHPLVRGSHERWDGDGYPDGLAGEAIPLGARIIAACDAFNAMTSDRPYRDALSPQQAAAELERCAGTQFDPAVIETLVAALDLPAGEVVDLRTAIGF